MTQPRPTHVSASAQSFMALTLLTLASWILYVYQFADTNAYTGIVPLPLHRVDYWWLMALWLVVLAALMPARPSRPSDVFLVLYIIGCCLWPAAYWPAVGLLDTGAAATLAAIMVLPAAAVHLTRSLAPRDHATSSSPLAVFRRRYLLVATMGLVACAAVLSYRLAGDAGGFSLDEATARRLQGRETFSGAALPAYLLQMSANGLAPFLAFLGALRRSWLAVVAALAFALLCFWLLGLKSPVAYVFVLTGLGWLVRRGQIARGTILITGLLGFLMAFSIIEMLYFDVSVVAEFLIRRMTLVSSVIQAYFMDALGRVSGLSLLGSGFDLMGHATPEYYIGATYMGSDLTNANTNAYLHELAVRGVLGYVAVTLGTCLLLAWCDRMWRNDHRPDGFAFATVLAILVVEQAFTTALVSSGLALCMVLSAMFARGARPPAFGERR